MLLQEISQILAAQEVIVEKHFHEKHHEDIEETGNPWITFDEEKTKEPENEEFIP
jgi:hypothetical protein